MLLLAFAFGSRSFRVRISSADVVLRQMALRFLLVDRLNGVFLQFVHVSLHVALFLRMVLFSFDNGLYAAKELRSFAATSCSSSHLPLSEATVSSQRFSLPDLRSAAAFSFALDFV